MSVFVLTSFGCNDNFCLIGLDVVLERLQCGGAFALIAVGLTG